MAKLNIHHYLQINFESVCVDLHDETPSGHVKKNRGAKKNRVRKSERSDINYINLSRNMRSISIQTRDDMITDLYADHFHHCET